MSGHIDYQVIEKDGQPVFAVLSYDDFMSLLKEQGDEIYFPDEVVRLNIIEEMSLPRAWREFKNMTQSQVASKLGISQSALAQMERVDANLRMTTLKKLADVFNINIEQLKT